MDLVAAARAGDRDALDELLRRHHDRVFSVCRRLTGNHADALDATQEALITIARRLDRFDGRASFSTWAYRVATNACLDELRRRSRRPIPFDHSAEPPDTTLPPARPSVDPAPSVAARLDIDAALAELPVDFRVAVVLRDVLTLDYQEIAEVTSVPIGTVRSRIARGRALLARRLREVGIDPGSSGNHQGSSHRQNTETD